MVFRGSFHRVEIMTHPEPGGTQRRKVGWILLWLLGVPIPVLLLLFAIRGCT
jgi:hypothetical protein